MTSQPDAVAEAESFLAEHWSPDVDRQTWRELVVDERWAALRWPVDWFGRGLDDDDAEAVDAVFARAGAPGPGQDRYNLRAGTLLAHGADQLQPRILRELLTHEGASRLLSIQPGAGGDLEALHN